jgi:tripartite-type tricarboxylate transporter receptor subunit TctC
MRGFDRRTTLVGMTALLVGQASGWASEDAYPSRDVRIICSVPAGGGVDLSARIVAAHLQTLWGNSFVVENRTGGASNLAADAVAHAAPDGYTLLAVPPNVITANAALFKDLTYDPASLEPVAIMATAPNVLAIRNGLPIRNVAELIAFAKANPNKLSYASQGNGSTSHLKDGPELLASVNPTFTWVRLAQRIPVRIRLTRVPAGVLVAAGMTCTVTVGNDS